MTTTRTIPTMTKEPKFSCMIGLPADGWCGKCGEYHYRTPANRNKHNPKHEKIAEPKVIITIAGIVMADDYDARDELIEGDPLYGLNLHLTHRKEI